MWIHRDLLSCQPPVRSTIYHLTNGHLPPSYLRGSVPSTSDEWTAKQHTNSAVFVSPHTTQSTAQNCVLNSQPPGYLGPTTTIRTKQGSTRSATLELTRSSFVGAHEVFSLAEFFENSEWIMEGSDAQKKWLIQNSISFSML